MKTPTNSKRNVPAARIPLVAAACLILTVGSAVGDPGLPVGTAGSTATGSCGVGAAQAEASTAGLLSTASADAGGGVAGERHAQEQTTEDSAWAETTWVAKAAPNPPETTAATWSESQAKNAFEIEGASYSCDFRPVAALLMQALSGGQAFQTGCSATTNQVPATITGVLATDGTDIVYIVGHRNGEAFTHALNDVTFLPGTQSQPIPAETSILGGVVTIAFTEHSCSIVGS